MCECGKKDICFEYSANNHSVPEVGFDQGQYEVFVVVKQIGRPFLQTLQREAELFHSLLNSRTEDLSLDKSGNKIIRYYDGHTILSMKMPEW